MAAKKRSEWGGARPGSGPKPLPESERRRHAVLVVLNDAEREAVASAADGSPLAVWVREAALRAARRKGTR